MCNKSTTYVTFSLIYKETALIYDSPKQSKKTQHLVSHERCSHHSKLDLQKPTPNSQDTSIYSHVLMQQVATNFMQCPLKHGTNFHLLGGNLKPLKIPQYIHTCTHATSGN